MKAQFVQTRSGCFFPPCPRLKKRKLRHKTGQQYRDCSPYASPCKHWHGKAAQLYHEQLMKEKQLKAGMRPEASLRDMPTASQNTAPLSPRQENVTDAPAQVKESYLAWFDGACEPVNPGGTATFGVVIKDNAGRVLLKDHGIVGKGSAMSNNVAEYAGVLHILKYLASRPPGRVTIYGDSNLATNQLNGKWRVRKGLYVSIAIETKELLAYLCGLGWQISFRWIPREQNEECDALSKESCQVTDKPRSEQRKGHARQADARDARMIGRTIKTTGIIVLRGDASRGSDWWVCRCACGREFVAHGWGVRHGHTRNCGSDEHKVQAREHQVAGLAVSELSVIQSIHACRESFGYAPG